MCDAGRKCCKQLLLHSQAGKESERQGQRERDEAAGQGALLLLYGVKLFICERIKEAAIKSNNNKYRGVGVGVCGGGVGVCFNQHKESSTNFWP